MITLFPDQQDSIDRLRQSMTRNKRILFRGETGFGKSICAAYMIRSALAKGKKCVFHVPRKELLRQMADTFEDFDIPFSYIAAGKPFNPYARVFLATVGTAVNRLACIDGVDLVFIDESHHGANQLDKINSHYTKQGAFIIGLTATPDNPNLYKWYDDMVEGASIKELIAMKRLSDYRYFAPSSPDLTHIPKRMGDYAKGALNEYMHEARVLVGNAVQHYKDNAYGKLNMTFCTSIKNSMQACEDFKNAGIPSAHMDGDTPEDERRRIARAFAKREIWNLCSSDLLLFGYDLSSASGIKGVAVESMTDLKPTKSRNVQRQKIGRVLRYKEHPALIFDHAGNHIDHGMPTDEIEWSLTAKAEPKNKDGSKATRQCDNCFHIYTPAPKCPECGHINAVKERKITQVDGELQEITGSARPVKKRRNLTLNQLVFFARKKGIKNPTQWATEVIAKRMAEERGLL